MTSTINILSLPPELITYILTLLLEESNLNNHHYHQERYEILKGISLISRYFRNPAQELLWNNVKLSSQLRGQQFLSINNLNFNTKELSLGGIKGFVKGLEGISSSLGNKFINTRMSSSNLTKLTLLDFSKLSSSILWSSNLINLKELTLSTNLLPLSSTTSTSTSTLPFKLTHLTLNSGSYPSSILYSILQASSTSLRYLNISLPETSIAFEGLIKGIKLVGSTLEEIILGRRLDSRLAKELKWCIGLKRLKICFAGDLEEILDGLSEGIDVDELEHELELGETRGGGGGGGIRDERKICRLEKIIITIDYNLLPTITTLSSKLFPHLIIKSLPPPPPPPPLVFNHPPPPPARSLNSSTYSSSTSSSTKKSNPIFESLNSIQFGNAAHWKGYEIGIDGFVEACKFRGIQLIFAGSTTTTTTMTTTTTT